MMNSLYEPLLIEVAWEVCNQLGGIYTVIQSKVPYIRERWGDQYCLIGPSLKDEVSVEFQPTDDYDDPYGRAVLAMREAGYKVEYGYWLVTGKPRVILLNINQVMDQLDRIKGYLLEHHQLYLPKDELTHQVLAFSDLVLTFMQYIVKPEINEKQVIAHFHEWMASATLPEIKRQNLPVATVFTTHATSLGRFIASNEPDFYKKIARLDWRKEAIKYGIEGQVQIERAAAHAAEIMSTVSRITDIECEYLLGRKSDIILPNGLNIDRFTVLHELQNLHLQYKKKINEFVMGHFFNNYTFDLENTLYFFTSGRYEPTNKGYDITLEALHRLNERMKRAEIKKTVVMFFVTKRPYNTINPLVLELRSMLEEIKNTCGAIQKEIGEKLFYAAVENEKDFTIPNLNELVDEYWQFRYKKTIQSWKTPFLPIIVTHNLKNDQDDAILDFLRKKEFYNKQEDPVKIIYHPDFIDSTNPLFKLDYQQFVRGCHLGIFPSYYEPWGYTPVECIARGVATVTSDLAGFGDFVKQRIKGMNEKGIYLVNRRNQTFDEAAEQLTDILFDFVELNRRERIQLRNNVESTSSNFSWESLGRYYSEAYRMAVAAFNKHLEVIEADH